MPCSTIRAWTLGIIFAIILPGLNQFFYMRYPSVVVSGVSRRFFYARNRDTEMIAILVSSPVDDLPPRKGVDASLSSDKNTGTIPQPWPIHGEGTCMSLNLVFPPLECLYIDMMKVLATIMASVGFQSAYAVSPASGG
jgi:hypothetical protein